VPMERAMAVDETARALEFLRDARFCTSSTGGVGSETEISLGCFDLPKMGIMEVDDKINSIIGTASRPQGWRWFVNKNPTVIFIRFRISNLCCYLIHVQRIYRRFYAMPAMKAHGNAPALSVHFCGADSTWHPILPDRPSLWGNT